jgi:hypothetical protein
MDQREFLAGAAIAGTASWVLSSDHVVGKNCSQPLAAQASDRPNSGYQ